MTEAQQAALKTICGLMSEHFDAGLLVVTVDHADPNRSIGETEVWWRGGAIAAIGMASYAGHVLQHRKSGAPSD